MTQVVNHPRLGKLNFPDGMSESEQANAIIALEKSTDSNASMNVNMRPLLDDPMVPEPVLGERVPKRLNPMGLGGGAFLNQKSAREGIREGMRTATAETIRYAPAVLAGIAASPTVLPTAIGGIIASGLTVGAATGLGSFFGEYGAQTVEKGIDGKPYDHRKALSMGVYGSTPFFSPATRGAVQGITKIAANTGVGGAYGALGSYLDDGKVDTLDVVIPGAIAPAAGLLGGVAQGTRKVFSKLKSISQERFGGRAFLHEAMPWLAPAEARLANAGSAEVADLMQNVDRNFARVVKETFKDVDPLSELGKEIARRESEGKELLTVLRRAKEASTSANDAARRAIELNQLNAPELATKAKAQGFETMRANLAYNKGMSTLFPNGTPALDAVATGARKERAASAVSQANKQVKAGIAKLYDAAAIRPNDIVVNAKGIESQLRSLSRKGGVLEGRQVRKEVRDEVENYIRKFAPNGNLTRQNFQMMREGIASMLENSMNPSEASRVAGGVYNSVSRASDRYLKKALSPERYKAWNAAQSAARNNFERRGSEAVKRLMIGDSEGLMEILKKDGAGDMLKQLEAYGEMIGQTVNVKNPEAVKVAKMAKLRFEEDHAGMMRDFVIDSGSLRKGQLTPYNVEDIAQTLNDLKTRGYPIENLAMGSPDEIKALARISRESGQKNSHKWVTKDDLNSFFDDAAKVGANTAAWRRELRRAYVNQAISRKGRYTGRANKRLILARRKAGVTEKEATRMAEEAMDDPIVKFMNGDKTGLSASISNNDRWVQRLENRSPEAIDDFFGALESAGRSEDIQQIKKSATAYAMRRLLVSNMDETPALNVKEFQKMFNPNKQDDIASLKKVMGREGYDELKKTFGAPASSLFRAYEAIAGKQAETISDLASKVRVRTATAGPLTVFASLGALSDMISNGRYHLAHFLYVNPAGSRMWKSANGSMEKIMKQPVAATAINLANRRDEESNQQQGQR